MQETLAGDPGSIPALGRYLGEGIGYLLQFLGFPAGSDGKESACSSGDLGWEEPLEGGMATHSSILACRIPMNREAWWAVVHRITRVGYDRVTYA